MMKAMLFKLNIDIDHRVDFCITGSEAVKQVIDSHEVGSYYKIIFTDFNMPQMSGIEATSKIRRFIR